MSINNMRLFCRDALNLSPSEPGDVVYAGATAVALQRRAEHLGVLARDLVHDEMQRHGAVLIGSSPARITATVIALGRTRNTAPSRIASSKSFAVVVSASTRSFHACLR